MHVITIGSSEKAARYRELMPQLEALVAGEPDLIANLANLASALAETIERASWVGFYLVRNGELVLGPFQGKVACTRIAIGRGVCGAAAASGTTHIVPDVNAFPGHIACDVESRSEIVVPIRRSGVAGVLDLDSRDLGAFDETDALYLERVAELAAGLEWPG